MNFITQLLITAHIRLYPANASLLGMSTPFIHIFIFRYEARVRHHINVGTPIKPIRALLKRIRRQWIKLAIKSSRHRTINLSSGNFNALLCRSCICTLFFSHALFALLFSSTAIRLFATGMHCTVHSLIGNLVGNITQVKTSLCLQRKAQQHCYTCT